MLVIACKKVGRRPRAGIPGRPAVANLFRLGVRCIPDCCTAMKLAIGRATFELDLCRSCYRKHTWSILRRKSVCSRKDIDMKRITVMTVAGIAAAPAAWLPADIAAQKFPSRPITYVVPLAAGSTTDVAARRIA